jgi:hypothetical protein
MMYIGAVYERATTYGLTSAERASDDVTDEVLVDRTRRVERRRFRFLLNFRNRCQAVLASWPGLICDKPVNLHTRWIFRFARP